MGFSVCEAPVTFPPHLTLILLHTLVYLFNLAGFF